MDKEKQERVKLQFAVGIVIVFGLGSLLLFGLYTYYGFSSGIWQKKLDEHFEALVGMPFCALFALVVLILLRATYGPIEFEVPGFRFKGASGPILLWCIAFMALVTALRILW